MCFCTSAVFGTVKPAGHFKSLSCAEKRWVIFHPFIAKKALRLSLQARESSGELVSDSLFDGDENGGQIDAFRHAYWMALLSQHFCWRKAWSLGKAHEKGNYRDFKKGRMENSGRPDAASGEMDLYNNKVGIEMGRALKKVSGEELKRAVRDSVLAGKMKVIRKNQEGLALDCDGNAMDSVKYSRQWYIPKCLVRSDYKKN